jgi:ATP-dependent RNA helicase SUPV3L1/SUV3
VAGWLPAGRVLLRLDVAERIAGELGYLTRRAAAPVPEGLASRLGVKGDTLSMALEAMGFRLMPSPPLEEGQFGPPVPPRISVVRQDRPMAARGPRRDARGDQPRGEARGRAPR